MLLALIGMAAFADAVGAAWLGWSAPASAARLGAFARMTPVQPRPKCGQTSSALPFSGVPVTPGGVDAHSVARKVALEATLSTAPQDVAPTLAGSLARP